MVKTKLVIKKRQKVKTLIYHCMDCKNKFEVEKTSKDMNTLFCKCGSSRLMTEL